MVSLTWCLKQKRGVRLIEPSEIKCNDYIGRSENDLVSLKGDSTYWKLIKAYYACYDALYALLMKAGIKSEIHDCSIELMGLFGFDEESIDFIKKLKDDRIQNQYYLKNIPLKDEEKVKEFVIEVKKKISSLSEEGIDEVRDKIKPKEDK
ncbi:MAG: hypothetical protein V1740_00235 [Candidatus Woesearchaeota archaeon]